MIFLAPWKSEITELDRKRNTNMLKRERSEREGERGVREGERGVGEEERGGMGFGSTQF